MNRTAINKKANREIKKQLDETKMYCWNCHGETRVDTVWLTIAHRHKRRYYYDKPDELLWHSSQWIIVCITCHRLMEEDKKLTEEIFLKLRGQEL